MAQLKGGEQLERRLAEIATRYSMASTLRVGFLEGATYPDGTPVALVAAAHNWGDPAHGLPPRPFFSNMVEENQAGWPALIAEGLRQPDATARSALEYAGRIMVEQLQAAIVDGEFAPLKARTVARKGFDKPLIHTSHMLNSVASEVT